jgi:multisubunit Na+/H+ antiporter MnhG subunit
MSGKPATMTTLYLLLMLIASILLALAAAKVSHPKVDLLALGLFFWVLVPTIQMLQRL